MKKGKKRTVKPVNVGMLGYIRENGDKKERAEAKAQLLSLLPTNQEARDYYLSLLRLPYESSRGATEGLKGYEGEILALGTVVGEVEKEVAEILCDTSRVMSVRVLALRILEKSPRISDYSKEIIRLLSADNIRLIDIPTPVRVLASMFTTDATVAKNIYDVLMYFEDRKLRLKVLKELEKATRDSSDASKCAVENIIAPYISAVITTLNAPTVEKDKAFLKLVYASAVICVRMGIPFSETDSDLEAQMRRLLHSIPGFLSVLDGILEQIPITPRVVNFVCRALHKPEIRAALLKCARRGSTEALEKLLEYFADLTEEQLEIISVSAERLSATSNPQRHRRLRMIFNIAAYTQGEAECKRLIDEIMRDEPNTSSPPESYTEQSDCEFRNKNAQMRGRDCSMRFK